MSKANKKLKANLEKHIDYLASDALEGRRTGSEGERKAAAYIINEFENYGIQPAGNNGGFLQPFEVHDGRFVTSGTFFSINGKEQRQGIDYFPLAFSGNASASGDFYFALKEQGEIWGLDLADELERQSSNPHWSADDYVMEEAKKAALLGATALIVYNTGKRKDNIQFDMKSRQAPLGIPVIYINRETKQTFMSDESSLYQIKINVNIQEKRRTGNNVIGKIDNNAPLTIIIGAHYDHLGRGQDHNSRYLDDTLTIHNGADDNASGVAAMIELSRMLKKVKTNSYNFLFIAFSGEELGLYGSKAFTENPSLNLSTVDYMINMDMVGRLNDSTKVLTIGGFGTSPSWLGLVNRGDKDFVIHIDSSGTGPSDHTSFYLKNIPVLFFFTGTHQDYHRPEDDADKINYNGEVKIVNYIYKLVKASLDQPQFVFQKTKETTSSGGNRNFKVTLGIMPDYTYSGSGIHVDGVSPGKSADKAGIKTGDVLIQLGDYPFTEIESYMTALSKFNKGESTTLKYIRNGKVNEVKVTF